METLQRDACILIFSLRREEVLPKAGSPHPRKLKAKARKNSQHVYMEQRGCIFTSSTLRLFNFEITNNKTARGAGIPLGAAPQSGRIHLRSMGSFIPSAFEQSSRACNKSAENCFSKPWPSKASLRSLVLDNTSHWTESKKTPHHNPNLFGVALLNRCRRDTSKEAWDLRLNSNNAGNQNAGRFSTILQRTSSRCLRTVL